MSNSANSRSGKSLEALDRALQRWTLHADLAGLETWFDREVDDDGAPRHLEIAHWWDCLDRLHNARGDRAGWPRRLEGKVLEFLRSALRFTSLDGRAATGSNGRASVETLRSQWKRLALAFPGSGEARVLRWWLCQADHAPVPPPLPAWSGTGRVLASLRASWKKPGDLLAVDHRTREAVTRFELVGGGKSWLGPGWSVEGSDGPVSLPRLVQWRTQSAADLAEWTFRQDGQRVTRTALVLRDRRIALFADLVEGKDLSAGVATRLDLPDGVRAEPIPNRRGVLLRPESGRTAAQVLPLALPALPYETDRGAFAVVSAAAANNSGLRLRVLPRGRKCWLPVLVSWDAARHRKDVSWRLLTVSQDSRTCGPDEAFAVRLSWGRSETLVFYRSLATPAARAFLGHQTSARLLVGSFNREGVVVPLVILD